MKRIQFMAIVAASLLWISPAQAHGDEEHGEAASAVVSDAASKDIQAAQGHGDTAADHDGAKGQDADEGDKGESTCDPQLELQRSGETTNIGV